LCSHHLPIALFCLTRWQVQLCFLVFLRPRTLSVYRLTIFEHISSEPVTEDDPGGDYGNKSYPRVKHRTCRAAEERLSRAAVEPRDEKGACHAAEKSTSVCSTHRGAQARAGPLRLTARPVCSNVAAYGCWYVGHAPRAS